MNVRPITTVAPAATPSVQAQTPSPTQTATGTATTFDRTAALASIGSELSNAVAFTAQAHHGWGGGDL